LKALFARGEYKQGVDDAFGAFWNALVERKIVPVTPEKVESTYREMVTKPIDKIEALNLAELPIMEESKRSEITKSQVEINTITSKLTGMGV